MGLEIERKFIVAKLPTNLLRLEHYDIEQGYTDHKRLRRIIRSTGSEEFILGCKKGTGLVRVETERKISETQFWKLWNKTRGRRLQKTRYLMELGDLVIEIDVFRGRFEGLKFAEVEFKSKEQAEQFTPPNWFGKEVTDDVHYSNRSLATHGLKYVREEMAA